MSLEASHTGVRWSWGLHPFIFLCILFSACASDSDLPFVARVGDAKLYSSDLDQHIPKTVSAEDSSKRSKVIINNWIRKQVVLQQAKFNLDGDQDRFKAKVEEYLNDLIIYEFENRFVQQKLDTVVGLEEMKAYYDQHVDDFVLRDHALRLRYALLDSEIDGLDDMAKKMDRYNELDSMDVAVFCESHATQFDDRSQRWVYLSDLLEEVPLPISGSMEDYFSSNRFIDKETRGERLLIGVKEYRSKGSVSPFGLERERIRNTILNTRKIEMLEEMRSNLFSDAIRNGDIEIKGE